ncbi:MAG: NERD domain-containing protein [Myxococcota bacterium]
MVPSLPPSEYGSTESENDFWYALRDELPDDFYVLYGLEFLTHDAVQGEIDFLIMHRELGMLNVECKGGGVYRDHNDHWWRTNPNTGKKERMHKTPASQAADQIRNVVDRLGGEVGRFVGSFSGEFPMLFGWALAFPYTSRTEVNVPPSLQPEIIFDQSDLGNLGERVREAFEFYGKRFGTYAQTLTTAQLERFIWEGAMRPFYAEPNLANRLDYERQRFVALSEDQMHIVNAVLANPRVAVSGGAGTGKTIVAMETARRLAKQGKDVLVTCFNSGLADHLQQVASRWGDVDGTVLIDNFHGICVDAAPPGSLDFPERGASLDEQRRFWAEDAPFSLLQALEDGSYDRGGWDAIIVDEAQDFFHEWWTILRTGLRDEGKLSVFFDARQSIFDHGSPVPTDHMAHFPLRTNFRNTKEICSVIAELGDIDLRPHRDCPKGEAPTVYQQPGPSKTQRKVGELVKELVQRQHLGYDDIAILTPHSPGNSGLEAAAELDGQPIVHDPEAWFAGEGVLHTTISAFKGMEADTIIMVDVDPDDPRCSREHRYVAASRAKHRLHVFEKGHWLE